MSSTYFPYPIQDDPALFHLVSSFHKTAFGKLHVVCSPKVTSPEATVFLHGIDDDWRIWTPLLQTARAKKHEFTDILLFDLPGFGQSQNLIDELDPAQVADAIAAIVYSYGYTRFRIVGHSMGGFLALDTATRFPAKVTSVISVAGTHLSLIEVAQQPVQSLVKFPWIGSLYWTMKVAASQPGVNKFLRAPGQMRRVLRPLSAKPEAIPEAILTYFAKTTKSAFSLAAKVAVGYDVETSWKRLTMPIVAIFGKYDRLVPVEDGQKVIKILPHATTVVIDQAGHWPQLETPHKVLKIMQQAWSKEI